MTFTTDVNLRADSTPETRPMARILTVLPGGTKARITELDLARPVPPNDRAAPGFRTWAKIEVLS